LQIIAHRGNLYGPDAATENTEKAIEAALDAGFAVEIDVWASKNLTGIYYLGHDKPEREISIQKILYWTQKNFVYLHCKDLFTLTEYMGIISPPIGITPFFHDKDDAILLTNGCIWVHPNAIQDAMNNCWTGAAIAVVRGKPAYNALKRFYGVCTDYPAEFKKEMGNGNS
jgi:hypothetical protein